MLWCLALEKGNFHNLRDSETMLGHKPLEVILSCIPSSGLLFGGFGCGLVSKKANSSKIYMF